MPKQQKNGTTNLGAFSWSVLWPNENIPHPPPPLLLDNNLLHYPHELGLAENTAVFIFFKYKNFIDYKYKNIIGFLVILPAWSMAMEDYLT